MTTALVVVAALLYLAIAWVLWLHYLRPELLGGPQDEADLAAVGLIFLAWMAVWPAYILLTGVGWAVGKVLR